MTLIIDYSLMVAALVDGGQVGSWADQLLSTGPLTAPHLMPVEDGRRLAASRCDG